MKVQVGLVRSIKAHIPNMAKAGVTAGLPECSSRKGKITKITMQRGGDKIASISITCTKCEYVEIRH